MITGHFTITKILFCKVLSEKAWRVKANRTLNIYGTIFCLFLVVDLRRKTLITSSFHAYCVFKGINFHIVIMIWITFCDILFILLKCSMIFLSFWRFTVQISTTHRQYVERKVDKKIKNKQKHSKRTQKNTQDIHFKINTMLVSYSWRANELPKHIKKNIFSQSSAFSLKTNN